MQIREGRLPGLKVIIPQVFSDSRGFFLETYQLQRYQQAGIEQPFVQDNYSRSTQGVLRGLHFQRRNPQGKLVRVVAGKVFDVAVDIRPESPTFGHWQGEILSEENKNQFWIPPGFAHGFQVLSEQADFEYKCTDFYDPDDEYCLRWDDPDIGIDWPLKDPVLSEKDLLGMAFKDLNL